MSDGDTIPVSSKHYNECFAFKKPLFFRRYKFQQHGIAIALSTFGSKAIEVGEP
jgi:hypothetical protein